MAAEDPIRPEPIDRGPVALPDDLEDRVYATWLDSPPATRDANVRRLIDEHPEYAAGIRTAAAELARGSDLLVPVAPATGAIQRIGDFVLQDVLGEGGFATVYRAVQCEPVRRVVALKLLHTTRSTGRAAHRFDLERDALASLQHPGIARMFEAGTAPDGRPYFAMELVEGLPIHEFAAREQLGIEERIRLFMAVCEAVQHAHQCGVVHRDLKPSNVLVAGTRATPEPKVIDFGLAKLAGEVGAAGLTVDGTLLGTPEYMSPEQAEGGAVDTRTDVWSLGVILFELLTGDLPLPRALFRGRPLHEVVRALRVETPRRASSVVRDGGLGGAAKALETELDWILMRALDADVSRRYATVAELRRDLRNHLDDLPVEARPPSRPYLLSKFIRRHRAGVALGAAGLVVLAIAFAGVSWALVDATIARDDARVAQLRAEASSAAANMAAGFAALDLNRPQEVRARLEAVPSHARHWEWDYLNSRVDASVRSWPDGPATGWHGAALCGDWLVAASSGDLRVRAVGDPTADVFARRTDTGDYPRLAPSPGGSQCVEVDKSGRARILSVPALELVRELRPGGPAGGATPAWSPDGTWIALGDDAGGCDVVRADGSDAWRIDGFGAGVRPCFDHESRRLACIGESGTLQVVDLGSHRTVVRADLIDPEAHVFARALRFAPDGASLACVFTDGGVTRIDSATGARIWSTSLGEGRLSDVAFVQGGRGLLVAGGYALSTLVLLDAERGRTVHRYAGHTLGVEGIAGVRDDLFYTVSRDGSARSWRLAPSPRPLVVPIGRGIGDLVFAGADRLVTASHYGTVRSWDLIDGRRVAEATAEYPGGRLGYDPVRGRVVVATRNRLTALDAGTLSVLGEHQSPIDAPFDVVRVPGSGGFVIGGWRQIARHTDTTLDVEWVRPLGEGLVAVDVSPDGSRVLAVCTDAADAWLLDLAGTLRDRRELAAASAIAFAPDGIRAATSGRGSTTRIWNWRDGILESSIATPGGSGISWTPDSTRVAIGCADGVMRICNPGSGDVIVGLRSAPECSGAVFSADGRRLASLAGPLHGPATALVWSIP